MSLEQKVKDIIVDQLGVDAAQVTPEVDQVELIMAFEEEFGAEIPDEDAEKLTTVGAVIKYLQDKGITAD